MEINISHKLFTSESVARGHPDKVCDQISDAILDSYLLLDPYSRVAVEAMIKSDKIVLAGEVTSKGVVDHKAVVRKTLASIGYDGRWGLDPESADIIEYITTQSPEIAGGVQGHMDDPGAGDQGLMFGYACSRTESNMPLAHYLASKLMEQYERVRISNPDIIGPDAKSQVTIQNDKRAHTIVISALHSKELSLDDIKKFIFEQVIMPVAKEYIDKDTIYHINPAGSWNIGGPRADAGLTGRKIIVDTYGGYARHGGGAFSGKDPTKVDRSAAYAARYIAKNIVAARLADECEVQLAYAIGHKEPVSIYITTYGTGVVDDNKLSVAIRNLFPVSPGDIIRELNLRRPIYERTAYFGHFGRGDFPWESTDKADELRARLKK